MGITLFGKPLFIWVGALAIIGLFVTYYLGRNIQRYGFKTHVTAAVITVILGALHFILGAWEGLFE
jgi:predicted ferric reductase